MRRNRFVVFLVVTLFVAGFVSAQEADDRPAFVDELLELLAEEGWTAEEVAALASSAEPMNWNEVEEADPEVVALALSYYRDEGGEETEPGDAALIAHELALTAIAMEQSGFDAVQVARATLEGTRDALAERGTGEPDGGNPEAGLAIRDRVVSRVREQVREIANGRGPDVARDVLRRIGEMSDFGPGPDDLPPIDTPEDGPLGPRS
jgi:hypothetical protein